MNAIVLTIDRLRASALGAYGNTWFDTPELDRLASESFVLDQALIDSPDLAALLRSCLTGEHALRTAANPSAAKTLIEHLQTRAGRSTWISDETNLALDDLLEGFDETITLDPYNESSAQHLEVADSIEESRQAQLWEAVTNWLAEREKSDADDELSEALSDHSQDHPFLLWVHAQGPGGPWDAPLALRNSLVEEDEPQPPQDASVPNHMLPADFDPDEVHGAACGYAGQIMALDACLGALLAMLRESSLLEDTIVVLLGLRGFPLGEHRRLGVNDEPLFEELVHVPCLIRLPQCAGALGRNQQLFQPADLGATLFDWFELEQSHANSYGQSWLPQIRTGNEFSDPDHPIRHRPFALITDGDSRCSLRTPAWYFVRDSSELNSDALNSDESSSDNDDPSNLEENALQLYAKPDDRWEQNEVSALCVEVVDSLHLALEEITRRVEAGDPLESVTLDEELSRGVE